MWRERALIVLVFLLHLIHGENACPPSSCGKISNISYPFQLKGDPKGCGLTKYELYCENNITLFSLVSGTFHVQAINYHNFTIRLVNPTLQQSNSSSLPCYFFSPSNFTTSYLQYYTPNHGSYLTIPRIYGYSSDHHTEPQHIVLLNCSHRVTGKRKYVDTGGCMNGEWKGYIYAMAGDLIAEDFEVGCHVKLVALTSWWGLDTNRYSYDMMHTALVYGFELSWFSKIRARTYCYINPSSQTFECKMEGRRHWWQLYNLFEYARLRPHWMKYVFGTIYSIKEGFVITINGRNKNTEYNGAYQLVLITLGQYVLPYFFILRYVVGTILFIALLTYKWRRRHSSEYENIESYLEKNSLMPIRYTYKEIKKMATGFNEKLGEGGYGSVFKGKLRSGPSVAIKVLRKSKGNGQDFINEVATIGRIHHQNVVQLIGYCAEGSKRALVYEFMPNGSLDKFIFSSEGNTHLTYDTIYNIAMGVAHGITYLHHGCEMQILHFDIKPHNILLDEKFTPKVSDFGLAKLYPIDKSVVTMTTARGTIGYMAPELFYTNIGKISDKSDVYSFGMLLMEIASKRKNLNPNAERSSQLYFPFWIYDQLDKEKDIEMEDVLEDEKKIAKKMMIVSLWCIQLKPNDRPSMNKVVEMLEGDIENLKIPPKPSLYPRETLERICSDQTTVSEFISSSSYSMEIVTYDPLDESI